MVLSRGNTGDLDEIYEKWLGVKPSIQPMLEDRGLADDDSSK
jgi:Zn-dependent oligopeptidase